MFYLKTCIHLQEVVVHLIVKQEFNRASAHVVACFGNVYGAFTHGRSQFRSEYRTWCFFYHFLVSSLNTTLSFEQVNNISVRICDHLNLNVSRTCYIALNKYRTIAKSVFRFRDGTHHLAFEFMLIFHKSHSFSASTCARFDEEWESYFLRYLQCLSSIFNCFICTWNHRDTVVFHRCFGC